MSSSLSLPTAQTASGGLIEQGLTSSPTQYRLGYLGDSFTGQKTQPTVSKYTEGKKRYKLQSKCVRTAGATGRLPRNAETAGAKVRVFLPSQ